MPTAGISLNGPWWTYNSSGGQALAFFPAGLSLPETSFLCTLSGFDPGTTYYAVTVDIPGFCTAGSGGKYVTTSGSPASALGPAVATPSWATNEGTVTRPFTVSLTTPMTGAQLNGAGFQVNPVLAGGVASPGDVFGFNSLSPGVLLLSASGSTNPNDGGQTPPEPINLTLAPAGVATVIQGTQQTLNALAVSAGGTYFPFMSFSMTVVTPGLGTFAENGGTSLIKSNPNGNPAIAPVLFNIAPGFVGYGQIRCENFYANNSPQFWTFNVQAPVVASGGGFMPLMQIVESF